MTEGVEERWLYLPLRLLPSVFGFLCQIVPENVVPPLRGGHGVTQECSRAAAELEPVCVTDGDTLSEQRL